MNEKGEMDTCCWEGDKKAKEFFSHLVVLFWSTLKEEKKEDQRVISVFHVTLHNMIQKLFQKFIYC